MLNRSQFTSISERLTAIAVSYAVGAGYVAPGDEQIWIALAVAVLSGAFALISNRQARLADRAADAGLTVLAPDNVANKSTRVGVVSETTNKISPR